MSDEVERSLIRTCRGWEKAYDALWVRVQALTIERDEARDENARLRAALAHALTELHAAEIEEVEAAIERGDLGEPVTADELKRRVRAAAAEGREPT